MNILPEDKRATLTRDLFRRWADARKDWDITAREDIDFYLGNHWTPEEVEDLSSRNQSSMSVDRLYSAIEQFKAIVTSKPPKFSAVAREDSDSDLASTWRTILEYVWEISDGNEVFKQAVHDYAVTGLGYFYAYIDNEADYGRGEVKFTYVDPFRVYVDPASRNKYFDDASGMILSTIYTKEQLINQYPQLSEPYAPDTSQDEEKPLIDFISSGLDDSDEDYPSSSKYDNKDSFTPDTIKDADGNVIKYRVLELFEKVKVPFFRVQNKQDGTEKILDYEEFEMMAKVPEIKALIDAKVIEFVEVIQTRIRVRCSVGQIVLYEYLLNTDKYPVVPVPNIWTNTPYPMGDVRKGKDLQRFINKLVSLITSHAQSSAGLKLLIPQGSITDIEQLEKDWANPTATIEYDASFGEPHFPQPAPLAGSILQLPQMIENYIDLNMGIFEMQQGNTEAAPRTASATMQMEDFGARRSKSKLRDIEGSLKRLGKVIYNLSKKHYDYQKMFRLVQPNNDLTETTVNFYDDRSQEIGEIKNDIQVGEYDILVVGNSTMPSNKWGEWQVYLEAFQLGIIDKEEALKKTEIFDKEGILQRTDTVMQLQQALGQAQEQIKNLEGDLQTAQREMIAARKQTEVEKFKTKLNYNEQKTSADAKVAVGKLQQSVNLESEKLRVGTKFAEKEAKLKAAARDNSKKGQETSKKE